MIKVGISGAAGKMGREVVKAILADAECQLVMAIDPGATGQDAALLAGLTEPSGILIQSDLKAAIASTQPDVIVDFTAPSVVLGNALSILETGTRVVIGTTGLQDAGLKQIQAAVEKHQTAALVAPNFALGGVLMIRFAQEAAKYFDHAEIIEFHHNQKLDAPSGTSLRTAELMQQSNPKFGSTNIPNEKEELAGARGATTPANLHIHSIRLPGMVAHQEVIFGSPGQTLTIRHDSIDRSCYMPGVLLAIKKIVPKTGFFFGLETMLDE